MHPQDGFLTASGISKRFGVTQALSDVSVSFRKGEVHALMGENGAGKSTLGKVIAGLHKPDSGTVRIDGLVLRPGSIDAAFAAGIRIVHQELAQCPNLSVAENLNLHALPRTPVGLVDFRAMAERAARLVHALDPGVDVEAPLGLLSPGRRQICQIAAALDDRPSAGGLAARVIVLDEPTSSLSVAEADRLLEITRRLAGQGLTMLYVSHRMGEIFQVCDRVTVLRDGKFVATSVVAEIDEPMLVEQMIGRRLTTPPRRGATAQPAGADESAGLASLAGAHAAPNPAAAPILEVASLSSPGRLSNVSLYVRRGEVLGVGGLVGAGRSELLDAIFGLDPAARGAVRIGGVPLPLGRPRAAIAAGVGYVPEDRRRQGLFFELGINENLVMPFMRRLASLGVRSLGLERNTVSEKLREFQVKAASPGVSPGTLSGGNQQKVLIARWMGRNTRVLLLDEPTRGIDIGTKAEIYRLVRAAADAGAAILLVSSEMPELLALSDRIAVMAAGRLTGELTGDDMTQANILRLATAGDGARAATA